MDKIKGTLHKCNLYLKYLVENQTNKCNFFDFINIATDNLLEYHLAHYDHRLSRNSSREKTSDKIIYYLSKLKNPTSWHKIINPHTLSYVLSNLFLSKDTNLKNSFPLHDENSVKEFEIIDNTLKEWIGSMKYNDAL